MVRLGRAYPIRPHTRERLTFASVSTPVNYYRTLFPATENPIAEGGVWTVGGTNGIDWSNIRTTTNKGFGTQDGNQLTGVFNDSLAVLKGIWGADQMAQATVFNTLPSGAYYAEVELLLRFEITNHNARGYEVLFSTNSTAQTQGSYCEIAKWLGPVGGSGVQFVSLTGQQALSGGAVAGDILRATIIGNTITAYRNGTQVAQITDSVGLSGSTPWATGNPGMGHWLNNNGATGDPTLYGYSEYMAETLDIRAWRQPITLQSVNRAARY